MAFLPIGPLGVCRTKTRRLDIDRQFVFWCFAVCFAVSAGETQVWLGDLRVVVFVLVSVVFCCFDRFACSNGHGMSLYKRLTYCLCSCKDRAFSAISATLEEKKTAVHVHVSLCACSQVNRRTIVLRTVTTSAFR